MSRHSVLRSVRGVVLVTGLALTSADLAVVAVGVSPSIAVAAGTCGGPLAPGDHTIQVASGGRDRPFLLYVPATYDGHRALPLLLNLHMTLRNGANQMDVSEMRKRADLGGFLVAAPDGGAVSGPGYTWVVPDTPPRGDAPPGGFPDDIRYLRAVITKVQSVACQNHAKVFATGYSGGARMASALACKAADVITGIVADGGLRAGAPRTTGNGGAEPDPETCKPARPLPVIALHGTADPVNPYTGGGPSDWQYTVPQAFRRWGELLDCRPQESVASLSPLVDRISHAGCHGYSTITLYRINGGGHQWFGGNPAANPLYPALGPDPMQIKATEVVAATIHRYALRAPTIKRMTIGCRNGNISVRVRVATDSPLARLTIRAGSTRRTVTTRAATLSFPLRGRAKIQITAVDDAGLSASRARKPPTCH